MSAQNIDYPLTFAPIYQTVIWGGKKIREARGEQPEAGETIGESWEISQQKRGMSVVESGYLAGQSLAELMSHSSEDVVGKGYHSDEFPLLIKLLDAKQKLSVQVHPDDDLAKEMGVGERGKTECWYMIGDGGELFQGTVPGVSDETFRAAIDNNTVAEQLQRFETKDGDFFHLPARTVHALGENCLLFEIQQSCDITYRVYDWGRVGLDGKPRQLHIDESMLCIDFARTDWGPEGGQVETVTDGDGTIRSLVQCPYFAVSEWTGEHLKLPANGACYILMTIEGSGTIETAGGESRLQALRTTLIPAAANNISLQAQPNETLRVLIAQPRW